MWKTEMVIMVRHLINDLDQPYEYDDERIESLILIAAQFVLTDVIFSTTYSVDLTEHELTPDPIDTRDNDFINLVCLKAACIVETNEAKSAAGQAISIKDQGSAISLGGTGGVLDGRLQIWRQGSCKKYEESVLKFLQTGSSVGGRIIIGKCNSCFDYYRDGRR